MRWGDELAKGCKNTECPKLHPPLCPKSLNLKCLDRKCQYKMHTRKCIRSTPAPIPGKPETTRPGSKQQGGRPSYSQVAAKQQFQPNRCKCGTASTSTKQSRGQHRPCSQCPCSGPIQSSGYSDKCKSTDSVNCQCNAASVSNQGFPWTTVQQPMLEAYMERVVKESIEKLVRQLLTASTRKD